MAHDVFVSYSTEDKPIADAVCATLESRKVRCWIAPRDVRPGVPYGREIIDAISSSRAMVLVFSSHSNTSPYVMREVERAVSKGIPIIPFRIENVPPSKDIEFFISAPHWLDAWTPPLEAHAQRLADTVERLMGQEPPPRPAPVPAYEALQDRRIPTWALAAILFFMLAMLGGGGWWVFGRGRGASATETPIAAENPPSPTRTRTIGAPVEMTATAAPPPTSTPEKPSPTASEAVPSEATTTPMVAESKATVPTPTPTQPASLPTASSTPSSPIPGLTSTPRRDLSEAAITTGNAGQAGLLAIIDVPYVKKVIWSLDGSLLATNSAPEIAIYDTDTWEKRRAWKPGGAVFDIAFSPVGHVLAASSSESIKFLDADSGAEILDLSNVPSAAAIDFSPDGRLFAASSNKAIKLIDWQTGEEVASLLGHPGDVRRLAFTPDGRFLVSASSAFLKTWEVDTGQEVRSVDLAGWRGALAIAPGGNMMAMSVDKSARLLGEREIRYLTGHASYVLSLSFSPDGAVLATGSADVTIKLWDILTGDELTTLKGHTNDVTSVAFSPDGAKLASAAGDGSVRLWALSLNAPTPSPVTASSGELPTPVPLSPLAISASNASQIVLKQSLDVPWVSKAIWSSDGTLLVANTASEIVLYDGRSTEKIRSWKPGGHTYDIAFSPTSPIVAAASPESIRMLDASTGADAMTSSVKSAEAIAFSPDGAILSAAVDKAIVLLNADTGEQLDILIGHNGSVDNLAFSSDGQRLVSSSVDGIKIWEVSSRQLLRSIEFSGRLRAITVSPDGKAIAAPVNKDVKLWDTETGRELWILSGHEDYVMCLAFSPDGAVLATGSSDVTIKLWDVASGAVLATLKGQTDDVSSVAFSPDGATLASTSGDDTLRLWGLPAQ